jgi:hypothetical protein
MTTKFKHQRQKKAKGSSTVWSSEWDIKFLDAIPIQDLARGAHSTLAIFRGSSSAGTGCRWCGISC